MEKLSLDKMKNKGAAATAATIAAAGVLIGGSFDAPQDILKNDDSALAPPPIVEILESQQAEPDTGDDGEEEAAGEEEEQKRKGVRERVRSLVLRMPLAVRACVVVPLWALGWGILSLASLLWTGVLSPAGAAVLKWVILALMLLAALTLTVKTVFPKTPLKKILNRYTLLWVLGGTTLLCIADLVLQRVCPDMPRLYDLVRLLASSALLMSALIPILKREKRAKEKREAEERERELALAEAECEEAEEEETPEQAQARVEREILAMADSVSFR